MHTPIPESVVKQKQAKWICFVLKSTKDKTCEWMVMAQSGGCLGIIKWWSGWRRYCFFPEFGSLYEQDCLRDIADFCQQVTTIHKAGPMRLAEATP